jgi:hypothetical protein
MEKDNLLATDTLIEIWENEFSHIVAGKLDLVLSFGKVKR